MKSENPGFNYKIYPKSDWPPKRRPDPPFGPTAIEILRSCAVRGIFDASKVYERRIGYAGRIGIAFHRTLESLTKTPPALDDSELFVEEARIRFQKQLRIQEKEADKRLRERGLPRNSQRSMLAEESIVAEALLINASSSARIFRAPQFDLKKDDGSNSALKVNIDNQNEETEIEVSVKSNNGLLAGRIDRVEHDGDRWFLIDYKSALRDDLPGRYERQIQLYASMWKDTRGFWPDEGIVLYPLKAKRFHVSIIPEECQGVVAESIALIENLKRSDSVSALASPGEVCKVCDYRPWCEPFWQRQNEENQIGPALEMASLGIQGVIQNISLNNLYWKLDILWRTTQVQLRAPRERIPHLKDAGKDQGIRILDTKLSGLRHNPKAAVNEYTEIFLIED